MYCILEYLLMRARFQKAQNLSISKFIFCLKFWVNKVIHIHLGRLLTNPCLPILTSPGIERGPLVMLYQPCARDPRRRLPHIITLIFHHLFRLLCIFLAVRTSLGPSKLIQSLYKTLYYKLERIFCSNFFFSIL